jgi:nitrate reductase gamma subunit
VNSGSKIFMLAGSVALILLLGLPLLIRPMSWARVLGWKIPPETALANYLGRSLGGVALSIAIVGLQASRDPWGYRAAFDLIILIGVLMTAVHAYGYLTKTQPWFENVETLLYPLVSLLAWIFYPHSP